MTSTSSPTWSDVAYRGGSQGTVSSLDEESLEALIVKQMTTPAADGGGWEQGSPADYDRAHAVDLVQLTAFLRTTQPGLVAPLGLEEDSVVRRKFLARLQG